MTSRIGDILNIQGVGTVFTPRRPTQAGTGSQTQPTESVRSPAARYLLNALNMLGSNGGSDGGDGAPPGGSGGGVPPAPGGGGGGGGPPNPGGGGGPPNPPGGGGAVPPPTGPKMGRVIMVDGKPVYKMGGVPKPDWSGLASYTQPSHPGQYRSVDRSKGLKRYAEIRNLEPKWDLSTPLADLQKFLVLTLKNHGMEQCMYLPHPNNSQEMVNVIMHPHIFARDIMKTKTAVAIQALEYDEWDEENDTTFRDLLLGSLEQKLSNKVCGLHDIGDKALVVWIKLICQWKILTDAQTKKLKAEIEQCRIQQFPGMNLEEAALYLRPRMQALMDTRDYDPSIIQDFLKSLHGCFPTDSPEHLEWWSFVTKELKTPLKAAFDKYKMEQGKGAYEIECILRNQSQNPAIASGQPNPEANLDFDNILDKLQAKYQVYLHDGKWHAASSPSDSKAPPASFGASAVHALLPTLNKNQINALVQSLNNIGKKKSNNGGQKSEVICYGCGQKGHYKSNCPNKSKNDSNNGGSGPSSSNNNQQQKLSWKRIAPKDGQPSTKMVNGTRWEWCQKCNNGKGRWTKSHGTNDHGKRGDPPKNKEMSEVNHVVTDPCAWHAPSVVSIWDIVAFLFWQFIPQVLAFILGCIAHTLTYTHWPSVPCILQHLLLVLLWYVPFGCLAWKVPSWLAELPPAAAPIGNHKWRRRFHRLLDRHYSKFKKPKHKGASIKDTCFHKKYPLHLRSSCLYPIRRPSSPNLSKLSAVRSWLLSSPHFRSGYKRLYGQFQAKPVGQKGEKHRAAGQRKQGSCPIRQPIKIPPTVQKCGNRYEVRCPWQISKIQADLKPIKCWACKGEGHRSKHCPWKTKCWSCGELGHMRAECPTADPVPTCYHADTDAWDVHEPDICLDANGNPICKYPVDCPFAKGAIPMADLPTQQQLDDLADAPYDQVIGDLVGGYELEPDYYAVAFQIGHMDFLHAACLAPHKLKAEMDADASFQLIWDSGASYCISPDEKDFVELREPGVLKTLTGLASGLHIKGIGVVEWTVLDVNGQPRILRLPAYYVPKCPVRLLSTTVLLQKCPQETLVMDENSATLTGVKGDPTRRPVKAFVDPANNIPSCSGFRLKQMHKAALALQAMISTVDPRNINLTEPEKELLRWHQRFGHLDFNKIKFLLQSGALCLTPSKRALHTNAAKIASPPGCAACRFGKQTVRPVKSKPVTRTIQDKPPVLKQDKLFPGQTISIDHFVCSTKGVTPTSRGGASAPGYVGGCIMVDNASGYVSVGHQKHLNTHETLEVIKNFEKECMDMGVVPQQYVSDSGSAFTSKEFKAHLEEYQQIIHFAGTGAHHHNSIAERSIRTIMSIARTMMLHSAIHWPEMADATLWPFAVDYAVHIFNRVPNPETGLSPMDVFTGQRQPLRRLHDLHVWGSPAYLLAKTIADGKKLPRWQSRSERVIFVGLSVNHMANIAKVLNPRTRAVTTPYNLVHDDWFATVASAIEDLPDFNTPEWKQMFGDSEFQYMEADDNGYAGQQQWTPPDAELQTQRMFHRREQIADRLQQGHAQPSQGIGAHPVPGPLQLPTQPLVTPITVEQRETNGGHAPIPTNPTTPAPAAAPISTPQTSAPAVIPPQPTPQLPPSSSPIVIPDTPEPTRVQPVPTPASSVPTPATTQPVSSPKPKSESRELKGLRDTLGDMPELVTGKRTRRTRSQFQPQAFSVSGNEVTFGNVSYEFSPAYVYHILGEVMPRDVYKAAKSDPDTMTLEQALAEVENKEEWIAALDKEIRELEAHEAWEEVPIEDAAGHEIVATHWVMKKKRKPDGSLDKFKARIVVRGDLMKSYDFETHAPTCAWSTIRMVLILALTWGWYTCTCDYSNAFIHATLDTPVWIHLPRGYRSKLPGKTCLKLKKSLYGTSFAPNLWFQTLTDALKKYGLKQSEHDSCLFFKPGMMACVYVDDLVMAFKDPAEKDKFFETMKEYGFTLSIDDTLESYLGIKFEKLEDGSFNMTQPALIDKIIEATGMQSCNKSPTPAAPNQPLAKDPDGAPFDEDWSYPSLVGMLMYLTTNTRPDLCFAVSQVARFTHDPKESHATAVKRIVRYLAGTKDKGTIMKPDGTLSLNSYSDSDFAGLYKFDPVDDVSSAKSRMGFIIKLAGCPLVWKSQLISSVCLATAEAEYYSLSHCLRVLLPINCVLEELIKGLEVPIELQATITSTAFEDNTAALTLARNHRLTSRTRYYHTAAHHFWQHVDNGVVEIAPCDTTLMDADYMTKSMPRDGFEKNRKRVQGW